MVTRKSLPQKQLIFNPFRFNFVRFEPNACVIGPSAQSVTFSFLLSNLKKLFANSGRGAFLSQKMTAEERTLSELTQHVAEAHVSLQGVPQEVAELQYLIEAQQLENYGREHHPAKVSVVGCQARAYASQCLSIRNE